MTRTFTANTPKGPITFESDLEDAECVCLLADSEDGFAQKLVNMSRAGMGYTGGQRACLHYLAREAKACASVVECVTDNELRVEEIVAMFKKASASLKRPRIRLAAALALSGPLKRVARKGYKEFSLTIATKGRYAGVIEVKGPGYALLGHIMGDGLFRPQPRAGQHPELVPLLTRFALDPQGVSREYAALTGNCPYCGLDLDLPASVKAGMGERCSINHGYHDYWKECETACKGKAA